MKGDRTPAEHLRSIAGIRPGSYIGIATDMTLIHDIKPRVKMELQPGGQSVWARPVYAASEDRGLYVQPEEGDEALVVVLNDDMQRCVAIFGLASPAASKPNTSAGVTIFHPEGTEVKLAAANSVKKAVLAPLPADLKSAVDSLVQQLQTAVAVPFVPPTAPDAGVTLYASKVLPLLVQIMNTLIQLQTKLSQPDAYLSRSLKTD